EFVEEDAELVDVARRRDLLAAELLGARVLRREEPEPRSRPWRSAGLGFVEEPRDPEVEEFRLAVGGDEDVRRLEVAVDDEAAVRVLDGAADADEEAEPLVDAEAMAVAPRVDPLAVDVLH